MLWWTTSSSCRASTICASRRASGRHGCGRFSAPHVAEPVVFRGERRKGSKSDSIDAHGLAERLRTGQITNPIFKAPRRFAKLRELARVYGLLTLDLARAKNRLKSSFRRRGVRCEGTGVYGAEGRSKKLRELPAALRGAVELLGVELDCLEELKGEAESAMVEESHRYRISRILETAPGLGPVRVAQLLPIVVTPHRFRTKRQFWAYCGFGVVTRSSADWVRLDGKWVRARVAQTRGLNFNFNRTLKMIFKGAATTVIAHAGPNPFREAYDRLCGTGNEAELGEGDRGAQDRGDGPGDVEERGGVRLAAIERALPTRADRSRDGQGWLVATGSSFLMRETRFEGKHP